MPFAMSTEISSMLILRMQEMDSNFTACIGFERVGKNWRYDRKRVHDKCEWNKSDCQNHWKTRSRVWRRQRVGSMTVCTRLYYFCFNSCIDYLHMCVLCTTSVQFNVVSMHSEKRFPRFNVRLIADGPFSTFNESRRRFLLLRLSKRGGRW